MAATAEDKRAMVDLVWAALRKGDPHNFGRVTQVDVEAYVEGFVATVDQEALLARSRAYFAARD